jgi:hypothetical protein
MALISRSVAASYMIGPHWENAHGRNCDSIPRKLATSPVYAELRGLEQLDETVAEGVGAAAEHRISADDLEKAAGGSLKEYLRAAIINTRMRGP